MRYNQNILILAFIVVLGFAAGYLYYSQIAVPARGIAIPITPPQNDLKKFDTLTIDLSILDSDAYKALIIFGEFPVDPGIIGKNDIFAP